MQGIRTQMWVFSVHLECYVLVLLHFRIRAMLTCNARFLSLSYSFRYHIITSYHHITASLIASESAICKESQWYESRVRLNEFLWILRVNWVVVCMFTARCKVSVAVPLTHHWGWNFWWVILNLFWLFYFFYWEIYVFEATGAKHAGVHIDHNFPPSIRPIISEGWK